MPAKILNEFEEEQLASEYSIGANGHELSRKYDLDASAIYRAIRRFNVAILNRSQCQRFRHLDTEVFETLSAEARYWLGFLMSDGSVYGMTDTTAVVSIGLAECDAGHLIKWRDFLKSDYPVSVKNGAARVHIRSLKLAEALGRFGVVPNKTGREKPPKILKADRDFWRGMVDGDGTITHINTPWPTLGLCGSQYACKAFVKFAAHYVKSKVKAYKIRGVNCWAVHFRGASARILADILYRGCSTALDRKQVLALQISKNLKSGADNE